MKLIGDTGIELFACCYHVNDLPHGRVEVLPNAERAAAGKVIHDMLANLPPGSWPSPDAHGIEALRVRAADSQKQRPNTIIVDSSEGPDAINCNFTLPDGSPAGYMIRKATLTIEAMKQNRLDIELAAPCVIALANCGHVTTDMDASLERLESLLGDAVANPQVNELWGLVKRVREQLDAAVAMIGQSRAVWQSWLRGDPGILELCARAGVEQELKEQAYKLNENEPHGLKVFPSWGPFGWVYEGHWVCLPPNYGKGDDRIAFGPNPASAVINWAKEHDTEEG